MYQNKNDKRAIETNETYRNFIINIKVRWKTNRENETKFEKNSQQLK